MTPRLVVLISGNGSNLQALIDSATASADNTALADNTASLDAEIVAVVSNQASAFGLERATRAGIPTAVVARDGDDRADYDRRLASVVARFEPDLVVLAGFMRILTGAFLDRFPVINLHPALPGTFPGTRAIERAFAAWQAGEIEHSGVMVHWVPDEGVDVGPEVVTAVVPFDVADTLDSFEARMHEAEHRILVDAVAQICSERSFEQPLSSPAPHTVRLVSSE